MRTRGEKVCAFIETYLTAPEGDHVGKPIKLEDFQRKFILDIYDNPYVTHTAYLSIARKNGKSALIAGILLAHLCGPEAVQNSQIVTGARSKDQAALIFKLARKMIEASDILSKLVRIQPSGKRLIGLRKNVEYHALAAEGKTAHGLSPILAIIDEAGQVSGPTDPFIDAVISAQGAYSNPLFIAISTQAPTDADLFSTWLDAPDDPRVVKHLYAAPHDCALDDPKAWAAANPAMGKFRSMDDIGKQCKRAMEMPANEPTFRNLILNQRVEAVAPFISRSVWEANGAPPDDMKGKKVFGGLDLSSVADLTSLELVSEDFDVESHFFLPEHGIGEKSRHDKVPYDLWAKQGHLTLTPGRSIQYEQVAEMMRGVFDRLNIQKIAFDRALFEHLKPWLIKAGFSEAELEKFVPYGQGTLSMTPALRALEVALVDRKMKHGNNPVLTMCMANARVSGDSGARKFDKKTARGRIDGAVALAMACGVMPVSEGQRKLILAVAR
jgi:phage terminase large subunit-like protein